MPTDLPDPRELDNRTLAETFAAVLAVEREQGRAPRGWPFLSPDADG